MDETHIETMMIGKLAVDIHREIATCFENGKGDLSAAMVAAVDIMDLCSGVGTVSAPVVEPKPRHLSFIKGGGGNWAAVKALQLKSEG